SRRRTSTTSAAGSASPTGSARPVRGPTGSASRPTPHSLGGPPNHPHQPPPDHAARERIRADTSTTLFVEAGAGAGKTTALVGRILTLVDEGVPIDEIAAITFTE